MNIKLKWVVMAVAIMPLVHGCKGGGDAGGDAGGGATTATGPKKAADSGLPNGWQKFQPPGETFSVAVPGTPTAAAGKHADGTPQHQWQLEAKTEGFIISYRDIKGSSNNNDVLLDRGVKALGTSASSKKITMGGVSAREADFTVEPGTIARVRMVIVNDRLYQFMIVTKDKTIGPDADTFLNSVSLPGADGAAGGSGKDEKPDAPAKADAPAKDDAAKTDAPAKDDAAAKPDAPAKDDAPAKTDAPAKDDGSAKP